MMNEVSTMAVTNTGAATTVSPTAASEWALSETTVGKRNQTTSTAVSDSNDNRDENHGPVGCYLVYESNSGGCLVLQYSEGPVPENAVGFFCPGHGHTIQSFKFKQNSGKSVLIKGIAGGDSNRRKYFSGWCQFLKLAVAKGGLVIQFTAQQGVAVDVYGYMKDKQRPVHMDLESGLVDVSVYDAVAVMPKDHAFMKGVKSIVISNFLELGNLAGASTTMK
jgi:Immune Mapped Protein 2 (IMP2) N-terminal domain